MLGMRECAACIVLKAIYKIAGKYGNFNDEDNVKAFLRNYDEALPEILGAVFNIPLKRPFEYDRQAFESVKDSFWHEVQIQYNDWCQQNGKEAVAPLPMMSRLTISTIVFEIAEHVSNQHNSKNAVGGGND